MQGNNSAPNNQDEVLEAAREFFRENRYVQAEPILNQLILRGVKLPEVFQMLGTIYYDQGKFNKAIRSFRRALELDPTYTDASVGLSIILNDLGRYEEGKEVFEEARLKLNEMKSKEDPYVNEKLAIKHDELGELYLQYQRPKEALEQYYKSLSLSTRKPEITMKIVECLTRLNENSKAVKELRELLRDYPGFLGARIRLGKILYDLGDVGDAVEQWEAVLQREPGHLEAQMLIRQSQNLQSQNHSLEKNNLGV